MVKLTKNYIKLISNIAQLILNIFIFNAYYNDMSSKSIRLKIVYHSLPLMGKRDDIWRSALIKKITSHIVTIRHISTLIGKWQNVAKCGAILFF